MEEYQQGKYQAKTIHYPDGGVETVAWKSWDTPTGSTNRNKAQILCKAGYTWGLNRPRGASEAFHFECMADAWDHYRSGRVPSVADREKAIRRAKTNLRRKVRAMGCDRMLTLTTRESENSLETLLEDWDLVRRLILKEYPQFAYIAVPELHPKPLADGVQHHHLHVAVRGYHDVNIVRRCWHQVLRRRIDHDSPGNVHIGGGSSRSRKHANEPERIARYLAKYLGKTLGETAPGRKSYWASKGAAANVKVTRWSPAAGTWGELREELIGDSCITDVRYFEPSLGILWLEGWVSK
jgi:hypothetical protein